MLLESVDDVAVVSSQCLSNGGSILHESELAPLFFDLRTRITGELFFKRVNYHSRLAIVVDDPGKFGERFSELVHEHQEHNAIQVFNSLAEARD